MRAEIGDAGGRRQVVLFDGARQVMDIVDVERKTYIEMTKADVERMATQMQGAMAMMQQQMATLPPAQRAQMEAMMRGRGMPGAAPVAKTEYKRNGTDHVGRWTCDKYDGYQNGEKTSELCTVAPTALGFGLTDLDVSRQLAEFYSKLVPQQADQIISVGRIEDQGFAGFPVRRVFKIGAEPATMEVTDVVGPTSPHRSSPCRPDSPRPTCPAWARWEAAGGNSAPADRRPGPRATSASLTPVRWHVSGDPERRVQDWHVLPRAPVTGGCGLCVGAIGARRSDLQYAVGRR